MPDSSSEYEDDSDEENSIKSSVAFDISCCSKGKGSEMRRRESPSE